MLIQPKRYRSLFSGLAWGQSVLTATPVSIARMAGAIANKGLLMPSRYVLQEAGQQPAGRKGSQTSARYRLCMVAKTIHDRPSSRPGKQKIHNMIVAGKTGTPERIVKGIKQSDGWYVFFAPYSRQEIHIPLPASGLKQGKVLPMQCCWPTPLHQS